jgi:hypothetical protein
VAPRNKNHGRPIIIRNCYGLLVQAALWFYSGQVRTSNVFRRAKSGLNVVYLTRYHLAGGASCRQIGTNTIRDGCMMGLRF